MGCKLDYELFGEHCTVVLVITKFAMTGVYDRSLEFRLKLRIQCNVIHIDLHPSLKCSERINVAELSTPLQKTYHYYQTL